MLCPGIARTVIAPICPLKVHQSRRHHVTATRRPAYSSFRASTQEHAQQMLEEIRVILHQTTQLSTVVTTKDHSDLRIACLCLSSLRIRLEALSNVTEQSVKSRQLKLMHTCQQGCLAENPVLKATMARLITYLLASMPVAAQANPNAHLKIRASA